MIEDIYDVKRIYELPNGSYGEDAYIAIDHGASHEDLEKLSLKSVVDKARVGLVDKAYVDDSVEQVAAKYLAADAQGNPFTSYASFAAGPYYYAGSVVLPTKNDYALVNGDETHGNGVTRYWYTGSSWSFQYVVNNTPFTTDEWNAIRSGITSAKVVQYDGYATGKADKSYVDDMLGNIEGLLAAL